MDHEVGVIDLSKFDKQSQLEKFKEEENKENGMLKETIYNLEKARALKEKGNEAFKHSNF
jgi:hypothetical protein